MVSSISHTTPQEGPLMVPLSLFDVIQVLPPERECPMLRVALMGHGFLQFQAVMVS